MASGALRDGLVLAVVFGVLLGGLYLYTAVWPPAVIVESGSMMHPDSSVSYGRSWLGGTPTIDPGDLVLVKAVTSVDDVETFVEGGPSHYGKPGDVIVYFAYKNRVKMETPIIHRAMAYVEVVGEGVDRTYRVRWSETAPCEGGAVKDGRWCVYDSGGVTIPSIPIDSYPALRSGFLTKGDNPASNALTDQKTSLSSDETGAPSPVQLEWIQGKGRAELPWLGLIKLSLAGKYNQGECAHEPLTFHFFEPSRSRGPDGQLRCPGWVGFGHAYAPKDLWVMLGVSLFLLVGVPLLYDLYKTIRDRRRERDPPPAAEP